MISIQKFPRKYKFIFYHFGLWFAYVIISISAGVFTSPNNYSISTFYFLFTFLPDIYAFYLCWFIYTISTYPLKTWQLVVFLILAHASYAVFWYITGYYIRPFIWPDGPKPRLFHFFNFITVNLYQFIKYALLSFSLFYFNQSIKREKQLKMMEKEKLDTENAFLRAQINPHFLNNTLNFFFAKSLPLSEELANGIMTLSEIMRYSLAIDSDDRMTLIEEEIEHIKNVIKINQLRFNHKLQIDFEIKGNTHNVRVIPLILITVVENILKHGNCTDKNYPVKIFLNITEADGYVYLNTFNRKKKGPKELSSGIGLDNIKKRLTHHYQKKFILNITESEQDYLLDLSIPFSTSANEVKQATQIGLVEQFTLQTIKPKPYTS